MPTLPKYHKLKRPKVVVKRTMKRHSHDKKSLALMYEKLKMNNKALAQALSEQKEENQQLFRENVDLSRQLNETYHHRKRHMEAFSIILKNSREAMDLMVKATAQVVTAISTCNTVLHPEGGNSPRPSSSRDPNRRGSVKSPNKSPARGVVQPMVSGHAIAQPAISLRRIRIAVPPNVSDIEETTESPGSPNRAASRLPGNRNRPLNRAIPPMLPQRIRVSSPRDEPPDDRRLSNVSRRSSRFQKRMSRNSRHSDLDSPRVSINPIETTMRSARVSLEDVSRLLHNSHSINVRSLMEEVTSIQEPPSNSQNEEFTQVDQNISAVTAISPELDTASPTSSPLSPGFLSSPTYQLDHRKRKMRKRKLAEKAKGREATKKTFREEQQRVEEDPLEGPSWRYSNQMEISGGPVEGEDEGVDEESRQESGKRNETSGSQERPSMILDSSLRASTGLSSSRMSLTMINARGWYHDEDDDDDERCQMIHMPGRNNDEETTNFTAVFSRNVCTSRGRVGDLDPDEFTMMRRPNKPFKPWTMADLEIPDISPQELESPMTRAPEIITEPEITKTIPIQGLEQVVTSAPELDNVTFNTSVTMPVDTAGRESGDDSTLVAHRRRNNVPAIVESSSDSETSTPPRKTSKSSRSKGNKRRDPSSAKVVLEKLKEPGQKKRPESPVPKTSDINGYSRRVSHSLTSDSESSNASFGSNGRPRRQKAPVNFAEPSLRKKLRRG
ncbi:uncharacterized protein [Fopius arisanus]|uniref:Shugoshin C-terminal domain-containing protein n=1 Tax=Fopius arisanus TaxID=64838 RepID=A0A9R1TFF0_9HYME|nr:PREDICTED: uncharacterized protein LOC105269497 [Fopius arisanus]XP_011308107.1 PREDICTED: uncharacterized protein LOC105269497 [Fopius arisanus]